MVLREIWGAMVVVPQLYAFVNVAATCPFDCSVGFTHSFTT